jgi:hypothetical protein
MPQKLVKPAYMDPTHSVDLFDSNRRNEFGGFFCVAAAISFDEVDSEWANYLHVSFGIAPKCIGCGKNEVDVLGNICADCGKQADEGYESYLAEAAKC